MNLRPRRLRKKLLVSFVSLVLLLLVGEVLVRVFTDTHRPILAVDAQLGRRYVKNFDGPLYNPESRREIHLRTNSQGLRFSERPFEKPPGVRRLIMLGDSFIAGLEVDEQDTACLLLEERLRRARPDERWEVLNFGVSGSGPDQEYVLYRELARRYQPDVVLCTYFVGNDFGDLGTQLSNLTKIYFELDEHGELAQVPYPTLRVRFNELLNEYSRLYVWQKLLVNDSARGTLRAVAAGLGAEEDVRRSYHGYALRKSEWVYCQEEAPAVKATWDVSAALFEAFAGAVEEDGARFGLVLMPAHEQLLDEDFVFVRELAGDLAAHFDPLNPNRRLAAICADLGVPFYDLLPALRRATPSHAFTAKDEWVLFNGSGHLNERGHALVAEALFQDLFENPERPSAPGAGSR